MFFNQGRTRAAVAAMAVLCLFVGGALFPARAAAEDFVPTTNEEVKNEFQLLNKFAGADDVRASTDPFLGLPGIVGRVISGLLLLVGSLALIMFVYAGFMWMWSIEHGGSESGARAIKIIVFAVIGLAVVFASYFAIQYVVTLLQP